ncbi:hypothetical protein QYE76_064296 [Lolium multiflorum]|uniref:J domain-containing protein n=1 Tax=Lolium multiflorum TaxID=4521 RepID=A0AAD8S671_LOLMU|nr:hypothetical protein QYE76_064296 [Lolium multiflorum]
MAACTASGSLTPFLHRCQARSWRRARFIVGASTSDAEPAQEAAGPGKKKTVDTRIHWFLGIAPEADIEEIKAAYRRLSKEYHPDTTRLPLKSASEKFIRLREVYNVLSKEETRRFYDWTLTQEAESRRLQQLRSRLEDPYELDIQNYEPVPDMVDRLGGKNMELSDQAMTALTFDIAIFIISICCIIYALFFKEQY